MADGIRGIYWVLHIDRTRRDIFLAAFRIVPRRGYKGKPPSPRRPIMKLVSCSAGL